MSEKKFNILVLDGGGSKGVYTIGVLKELEMKLGNPLFQHFNLIYGTSTGSIIAALIALGIDLKTIEELYMKHIPVIMNGKNKEEKSQLLKSVAYQVFGDKKFDTFKTDVGVVSLNYDEQKPFIFKSNINQAHGMKQSFIPGFGCTISEAIQSSCSAYPVFNIKKIKTFNQGLINTIDGGFIANNATLFALIDAHKAFNKDESDINLLNVGVGTFVEKPINWKFKLLRKINLVKVVERILNASTTTNVLISSLLFPGLKMLRINETFNQPEYGTNMVEIEKTKLKKLIQLGRLSFAKFEKEIDSFFKV